MKSQSAGWGCLSVGSLSVAMIPACVKLVGAGLILENVKNLVGGPEVGFAECRALQRNSNSLRPET